MKTTVETISHRMDGEPPPCLQCHHGRHSSTTSQRAATWPQDHDDNHAPTYSTRRRNLQAKLARTSLRLMTLWSGEPSSLYTPWPRTLYKGSQGTHLGIHLLFTHSYTIEGLLKLLFGQPVS